MLAGPLCLPLPGDEVDVVPQRRVVSGHVLCGGVLAGAVRFGGVRLCQRPQADQQRQGESQHRYPQPHGTLHLRGGVGWRRATVSSCPDGGSSAAAPALPRPARAAPRPPLRPHPRVRPQTQAHVHARPVAALTAAAAAELLSAQRGASWVGAPECGAPRLAGVF